MATTPPPPYLAVIFTNRRAPGNDEAYDTTAGRMVELAQTIDGYLGIESVRGEDQTGITISYWSDTEAIRRWRTHPEHLEAQASGRSDWYDWFELRIAEVTRARSFTATND